VRVDADWVNSPAARRILVHWADPRPAWLWAADGSLLLWRNGAARLFNARLKKSGLKLAPDPVPIRGQLARLVRLGAPGRSSLSRIQFLAGDKPVSTTCSVTPLEAPDGRQAVLLVAVDPIEPELLALAPDEAEPQAAALLPGGLAYLLVDPQGQVSAGSRQAAELVPLIDADATRLDYDGNSIAITRLKATGCCYSRACRAPSTPSAPKRGSRRNRPTPWWRNRNSRTCPWHCPKRRRRRPRPRARPKRRRPPAKRCRRCSTGWWTTTRSMAS
jgi:hypothetical protein